jgi:hypothetical protein
VPAINPKPHDGVSQIFSPTHAMTILRIQAHARETQNGTQRCRRAMARSLMLTYIAEIIDDFW